MFNKLKQVKDLRDQAKKLQGALSGESAVGEAAWGKVKITIDGNQNIQSVDIDPEFLSADKKADLEKAIMEASNDAIKKIQKVMAKKIQSMGGLDLPGMN